MLAQKQDSINVSMLPHPAWASKEDPLSNTGSNSQPTDVDNCRVEARIDNLSLLWVKSSGQSLYSVIDDRLGIKFSKICHVGRKIGVVWDRTWVSPTGTLYSERDTVDGHIHCRLSISGEDCERNTDVGLRGFARYCARYFNNLRCSRIDIAVDDYMKQLKCSDIVKALEDGNYSGVRSGRVTTNYGEKINGFTVNLGSRESDKFIRFYDKFAESGGHINCYRWEVEFKGELASALFNLYLEFPDDNQEYQQKLINYAVSSVKFIDKLDKNTDRCNMLEWWDAWLSRLKCTSLKLRVVRVKTAISAKKNWIQRSVAKSLLMIKMSIGVERLEHFLLEIMKQAETRIDSMDELILNDYRRNSTVCYLADIM